MITTRHALQWLIMAYAFALPLSIAAAQPIGLVALLVWIVLICRERSTVSARSPYFWPIILFSVFTLIASIWALRPDISIEKCHRLLFAAVIFMMADAYASSDEGWRRMTQSIWCFIAGCAVLGVYDLIRVPGEVAAGTRLFDTGNMRDPQYYMVALCCLLTALIWRRETRSYRSLWMALLLCSAGLIIHFKRGAWISFILAAVILGAVGKRVRIIVLVGVCASVLLFIPQVQDRLFLLKDEVSQRYGGRYELWTTVAPAIIAEHPFGLGWRGVTHEDLRAYSHHLQPTLNHLHNNVLQITLETGWLGVTMWILWMLVAFGVMLKLCIHFKRGDPAYWVGLVSIGGFSAIMLNGIVEYNFGDSEVLMTLCYIMGLSNVAYHRYLLKGEGET